MPLPNRLKSARLTNASLASTIDDELGNAEKAAADILGIPIDVDLTAPLLRVAAGGLQAVILRDLGVGDVTAAGEVGRKGAQLRFHDGTAAQKVAIEFPAGTNVLFLNLAVPVGWTRRVSATETDRTIILRMNGEVPTSGGTWAVGGLTFTGSAVANHQHETGAMAYEAVDAHAAVVQAGAWPHGLSGSFRAHMRVAAANEAASHETLLSSAAGGHTPAGTIGSDSTWRPRHMDVIVGIKD